MQYSVNREKIDQWLLNQVYPAQIARQRQQFPNPGCTMQQCWNQGYPYQGAIGGALTLHFTPTSLGTVTKLSYLDRYTLDLTNYKDW